VDINPAAVKDRNASSAAPDFSSQTPTKGRWWLLALISVMYLICYMDRANIGLAQADISREFGLDKVAMGWVFSAFAGAYALGQIPAGWLGDKFGPKIILTSIMLWWAVTAVGTGLAVGFLTLFGARFLLGIGEAGAFPVASRGMQPWFAQKERGRIQGITHFFSRLAVAITPFIALGIMNRFGWRVIFWGFGSIGIVWAIAFYVIYKNKPEESKHVNQAELAKIRGLNPGGTIKLPNLAARPAVPWGRIFSSPNMWFIAIAYGCFFYGTYFFLTWYPTYLREYRHFGKDELASVAAIPLMIGMVGDVVGGAITDFLYHRTGKLKLSRRIVAAPAMLLSGVFIIPAATTSDPWTSVWFLAASFFCLEMVIGPAWAVPMDVGGQYSGTVTGVMNMAGALGSFMTPLVFAAFIKRGEWVQPFFVTAGVMVTGTLIWTFLINPEKSVVDARP